MQKILLVLVAAATSGCAVMHHTQIGDIDSRGGKVLVPFEILISETTFDVQEAGRIAKNIGGRNNDAGKIANTIALFQMGPRTGAPVYNERYAEKVIYQIYEKCPSGRVTGLNSIRESREYPVVKGEIVKVTGYCMKERKTRESKQGES